jgi:hypothetical protein
LCDQSDVHVPPQLQPDLAALLQRLVALSIDRDKPLTVDLDLVFDSPSDE